jgi:glycine/D-amino acid oxidase-like deaminating enzyme
MINHYNAIIVGQGIAGTLISYALLSRGQSVYVIDKPQDYAASKAAAGLINPITGRYYTKSWMIDDLLPTAIKTYQSLEELLQMQYWYPGDIYRTLHNVKQCNDWSARLLQEPYQAYAKSASDEGPYTSQVSRGEGVALISGGGRVEVAKLNKAYRSYLKSKNCFSEELFDYDQLIQEESQVLYGEISADYIVFSEGVGMQDNPFFKDLPLQPAKGEALHIKSEGLIEKLDILKHMQYLVPTESDKTYWSGGGFKWKYESSSPTTEWKDKQASELTEFISEGYSIVNHLAGVRPCVKDRKPIIGRHPDHNKVYLFNGLGTKGTSLGPYFSEMLAEHILHDGNIIPEVNLNRFTQE